MRVLAVGNMYPPHHLGGYELMWRSSLGQLRAAGHTVRALTTDYRRPDPDPGIPEDPDVHRVLGWYWREHAWPRLSPWGRWRLERRNLNLLKRHVREFQPDAIAWWAMGGMSMALIERGRQWGIPAVGVIVDDWLLYGPREDQWQRMMSRLGSLRRPVGTILRVPSRLRFDESLEWLVVSNVILGHARSGGWALPRHAVVHAGVDDKLFKRSDPAPWRGRLLYVGRIDPRKGISTAVRALGSLPDASLTIVGDGDERHLEELRELAAGSAVAGRVAFERRPRGELPGLYASCDAVVFPVAWEEPFGIVPLEAMAVGRPVVATGTGGSGEYLADGRNCILYGPPGDHLALAEALSRLAEDAALRERIRAGGRETASRLTEDAFNRAVERALRRAVG